MQPSLMPDTAPLSVDREQVRMLAIAIGVRAAARKLGLKQSTVMQWSKRFKWLTPAKPAIVPPTVTRPPDLAVSTVSTPADILLNMGKDTRFGLAKAAAKAAETFSQKTGNQIIGESKAFREITSAASALHGWDEGKTPGVQLNIALAVKGMH